MDEAEQLLSRLQSLPDAAYEQRDPAPVADLDAEALGVHFRGMLLSTPRTVDFRKSADLAALLLLSRSRRRSAMMSWHDNAILTAIDLQTGTVRTAGAFDIDRSKHIDPDEPTTSESPPPSGLSAEEEERLNSLGDGNSAGLMWLEAGELLNIPAVPTRQLLRVFWFDQVSNAAEVEIRSDARAEARVSRVEATALAVALRGGGSLSLGRTAATPGLDGPGAAFALETEEATVGTRPLSLHGIVRLPIPAPMIVAAPEDGASTGNETAPPAAVLRAAVIVMLKNRTEPVVIPLEVPVWTDHPPREGDLVEAAFSLDLVPYMPPTPLPGRYPVYLLAGRFLAGPHELTLK